MVQSRAGLTGTNPLEILGARNMGQDFAGLQYLVGRMDRHRQDDAMSAMMEQQAQQAAAAKQATGDAAVMQSVGPAFLKNFPAIAAPYFAKRFGIEYDPAEMDQSVETALQISAYDKWLKATAAARTAGIDATDQTEQAFGGIGLDSPLNDIVPTAVDVANINARSRVAAAGKRGPSGANAQLKGKYTPGTDGFEITGPLDDVLARRQQMNGDRYAKVQAQIAQQTGNPNVDMADYNVEFTVGDLALATHKKTGVMIKADLR